MQVNWVEMAKFCTEVEPNGHIKLNQLVTEYQMLASLVDSKLIDILTMMKMMTSKRNILLLDPQHLGNLNKTLRMCKLKKSLSNRLENTQTFIRSSALMKW